jgi:hypothetical protein
MNRRELVAGMAAFGLCGEGATSAFGAPAAGWPDLSNTGAPSGARLAASKALEIGLAGEVVEALEIDGTVAINASNVTLRRCRIRAASFSVVRIKTGVTGVTIEDCEIDGVGSNNDGCNGIQGSGVFRRNNIHHVENGVTPDGGGPTVIEDNYIHDLLASGAPHYDCIQIDGGLSDVVIRHNTAINDFTQTSAVMIDNYFGPVSDVLVEDNLLIGGGFTIYVDGHFNANAVTNVRIVHNHMGPGRWGVTAFNRTAPIYEGNVADGRAQLKALRRASGAPDER